MKDTKKRRGKTAGELFEELHSDPEWVARKAERDRALQAAAAAYRKAEAPIVKDLSEVGFAVESVWDLVNTRTRYSAAVPILLEHLPRQYPERVREGIARALAVPESIVGWKILLDEFEKEPNPSTAGPKWALALALGAAGTDDVLDDVISLIRQSSLGRNRVPLIPVLGRSRDRRALKVLEELENDESIAREVSKALKRLRSRKNVTLRSLAE
jgi:hypothetical protein